MSIKLHFSVGPLWKVPPVNTIFIYKVFWYTLYCMQGTLWESLHSMDVGLVALGLGLVLR